jgi:hypothetical protein
MSWFQQFDEDGGSRFQGCLIALGVVVILLLGVLYFGKYVGSAITVSEAQARFVELTGTQNVVIIRHSNNLLIFGDSHDVTFELEVDGKPTSGRCTSGTFSPMVCRLYRSD